MSGYNELVEKVERAILGAWCESVSADISYEELNAAANYGFENMPKLTAMKRTLGIESRAAMAVIAEALREVTPEMDAAGKNALGIHIRTMQPEFLASQKKRNFGYAADTVTKHRVRFLAMLAASPLLPSDGVAL